MSILKLSAGPARANSRDDSNCGHRPKARRPKTNLKMHSLIAALIGLALCSTGNAAQTKVAITVDKDAQAMTVAVDGVDLYQWPVSTGIPSHETPNGSFRTFRMEEDHYSKEFDDAPMPHAIFFTRSGHAIHGTDSVNRLGWPASHGCVRLSRENASTLFALVQREGVLNTTVELSGSSQVALERNPRPKQDSAAARRDGAQGSPSQGSPSYDAAGNPVEPAQNAVAPGRRAQQQDRPQQAGDGYANPAAASSGDPRFPPQQRGYRRVDEARATPQAQQFNGRSRTQQPAPQPFQQSRGFFSFVD